VAIQATATGWAMAWVEVVEREWAVVGSVLVREWA
jgi:hypothetical protein